MLFEGEKKNIAHLCKCNTNLVVSTMSSGANPTSNPSAASAASTDREQKALEASTEAILQRVNEVKQTIAGLIAKLETDPRLNWPSFLDSYALASGQLNSLLKTVKHERTPPLKRYICLPLALSPDRDEDLARMTEGRVAAFPHDLVPDYLRTKPDPEVEQKHAQFESRASAVATEAANKQLAVLDKMTQALGKQINRVRDDLEGRASARAEVEKTFDVGDTFALVAAVSYGKGLKPGGIPPHLAGMRPGGPQPPQPPQPPPPGAMGGPGMAKAPSAIKTNIKAASQVHPYARQ